MAMMKGPVAANPDAYVEALSGWQRDYVGMLRAAIHAGAVFHEGIKWTNLLFSHNGPCIVIRAEEHRVIMAFFRGKRLAHLDPRIKPSGKFELANLIVTEYPQIAPETVSALAAAAAALNAELGDPSARH
ncbi:MAG TPA: DUF1801 domain-containing protein [Sphingorhabdus sp.]|jgi:hypothetical protein|nr:DUF1801 domain-containing protein [Sphingorhabdus sp.]